MPTNLVVIMSGHYDEFYKRVTFDFPELRKATLNYYENEPIEHMPNTGVTVRKYHDILQLVWDIHQPTMCEGELLCMGCGLHFVYPCPTVQGLKKNLN